MNNVLKLCAKIDAQAVALYAVFSRNSADPELRDFWSHMADEERTHVEAWMFLDELSAEGTVADCLEDPDHAFEKLTKIQKYLDHHALTAASITTPLEMFTIACNAELSMLDPVFLVLFDVFSHLNPEHRIDYEAHLRNFAERIATTSATAELSLLVDNMFTLWEQNRELADRSQRDSLTKLLNRRGFNSIVTPLAHLVSRNTRQAGILMLDLDLFKNVNDTLGHKAGDTVLVEFAKILQEQIRQSDIAGRFGGEEFIIYLPGATEDTVLHIAEKIRVATKNDPDMPTPVTVSIGGVAFTHTENIIADIETMIENADKNMYKAKQSGRDRSVCGHA